MLSPDMSGEMVIALSGCSVAGVAFAVTLAGVRSVSRDRRVGRLGVDLDWKPAGTGRGSLGGVPLLCGGMVAASGWWSSVHRVEMFPAHDAGQELGVARGRDLVAREAF